MARGQESWNTPRAVEAIETRGASPARGAGAGLGIPPALLKRLKPTGATTAGAGAAMLGIPPALLKRLKLRTFHLRDQYIHSLGIPPALLKRLKPDRSLGKATSSNLTWNTPRAVEAIETCFVRLRKKASKNSWNTPRAVEAIETGRRSWTARAAQILEYPPRC